MSKTIFIDDSKGYFKMHWQLWDILGNDYTAILMAEYLLAIIPCLKDRKEVNGDWYYRLSNSFVKERLNMSDNTIKKYLDILKDKCLIDYILIDNRLNGVRYIKLNYTTNEQEIKLDNTGKIKF